MVHISSFFGLEMDDYQGDLTDIVRASGGGTGLGHSPASASSTWEFANNPMTTYAASVLLEDSRDGTGSGAAAFGDPFCNMRDPLLHELNVAAAGSSYFGSPNSTVDHMLPPSVDHTAAGFCGAPVAPDSGGTSSFVIGGHQQQQHQKVFEEDHMHKTTSNGSIFQRIQISPGNPPKLPAVSPCESPVMAAATSSPRGFKASAMVPGDMINVNSTKSCLIENTGPVQIPSPRNLGIKRRKSQAKKVVCIPAPAAPNSRSSSGEVVPSDLWAWRKYGQKPIKGSPYPRGYYRCSSSKGCSARKQVERSRTDPNMLVITYTSEHNHPWPTQRNALAGSTRSQPTKNSAAGSSKSSSTGSQLQKTAQSTKEEQKESSNDDILSPGTNMNAAAGGSSRTASAAIKEEVDDDIEKQLEMDDINDFSQGFPDDESYRPSMPETSQSDDVFAELGEIEAEPFELLFTSRFGGNEVLKQARAGLDSSFSGFDWASFEKGK
ncbi:hypothetical protein Tsubulata_005957 [Turnera subulata]|uniref:WRKY domain-containing protein n=1 Tax=Turnera subulata TaxID=218843 RepID=A0A9Q0FLC0_9ROSI|nr:hypothetical protein Tsubulata_005957 [Turnera subulata]